MENPSQVARYVETYLRRGFQTILEEQRRIAFSKIYGHTAFRTDGSRRSRSGALGRALSSKNYRVSASGSGSVESTLAYPTYMRFLDMTRLGNYRIYNRPLWGILYKDTLVKIKYEYQDWLAEQTQKDIQGAVDELTK